MGAKFLDTAAYFDRKARKARSEEERARFRDAAAFYRALAEVTPGFPYGYKNPQPITPNGSPTADRLNLRAAVCRGIAQVIEDRNRKAAMEHLATSYELAARSHSG